MTEKKEPKKPPVVYGYCCVCGKECVQGQNIIAGAVDCQLRHRECTVNKRGQIEERWG